MSARSFLHKESHLLTVNVGKMLNLNFFGAGNISISVVRKNFE